MKHEVWYEWKVENIMTEEEYLELYGELNLGERSEEVRLFTPHADPNEYEHPADGLFKSPEEAREYLENFGFVDDAREEGWLLCLKTLTVVGGVT